MRLVRRRMGGAIGNGQSANGGKRPERLVSAAYCLLPIADCLNYADSRLRPLARRRESTFWPPLVAMRARKPWRRFRTSRLG